MKILKAKIKNSSPYFENGQNQLGKSVWLTILDFNPIGENNYKVKAVKSIKKGFPIWLSPWIKSQDIQIRKFDDKQLKIKFEFAE